MLWPTLSQTYTLSQLEEGALEALWDEYQANGYLHKTCLEMLSYSDGVTATFYSRLAARCPAHSPVKERTNSGWMADADFCFINIRACGLDERPGTLLDAAKLLPAVRANAIHLGPFTSYDFGVIYAVRSVTSIARAVVDPRLASLGFPAGLQMQALVEAAHLLGKTVGFDLEPHTAQFSIPVLLHPAHFRWIKLAEDKDALADGLSNDDMLAEETQRRLAAEVEARVGALLREHHLDTLESAPGDDPETLDLKDKTFGQVVADLIQAGYWTLPSHTWNGVGLPAFAGYNHEHNYARFLYLDQYGQDQGRSAYHILTPYKFYDGLPVNRRPESGVAPVLDQSTLDYFCRIFTTWRDAFGFDFVRYDSVDHIFDSLEAGDGNRPISDRPTPLVLQRCIEASRAGGYAHIGNFAERMGTEIEAYAAIGYDVMLGTDMLERVNRALIEKSFGLHDQLAAVNRMRPTRFAVAFGVDTHDTGNPYLWGEPLVKLMGFQRMRLRHFVSRFISAGLARRPKYEVMGAQDLSYGLYAANVSDVNLTWVGDQAYNRCYHALEDIYEHFRPYLATAEMLRRAVTDAYAWWVWGCQGDRQLLVAVASLELEGQEHLAPEPVGVDLAGLADGWPGFSALEYDFESPQGHAYPLAGSTLSLELPYLAFRLFEICG